MNDRFTISDWVSVVHVLSRCVGAIARVDSLDVRPNLFAVYCIIAVSK